MIVPFGKYRGCCVSTLLKDHDYKDDCKRQPWIVHYPSIYKLLCFSEIPNAPPIHRPLQESYESRVHELVDSSHSITGVSYDVGFHWAVCVSSMYRHRAYKTFVAMFDGVYLDFMKEQILYTTVCTDWGNIRLRFGYIEHDEFKLFDHRPIL